MKLKFKLVYATKRNTVPYKLQDKRIDFNDITFVHEGHLSYIINGTAFTVTKGQAMYCPDGGMRYRLKGTENAVYTSLNFKCGPDTKLLLPYHIFEADSFDLRFYLSKVVELYERDGEYDKAKSDSFTALIAYTLLENVSLTEENRYVSEIKNYISCNWNKKMSLEEIAESVHLSASYSSALFKNSTGVSVMDYIINLRITKACDMLKYSDRLISEIAESTGFCDIFYFSRMFKKIMGVSPAKYRSAEKNNFF